MKKLLTILFAVVLGLNLSAQVPDYVPTDGLVAWWPFNGNASDESGNGNDGAVSGATLTSDRFGESNSSYYFDGASYIEVANSASINIPTGEDLSWSVWILSEPHSSQGGAFEKWDNYAGTSYSQLMLRRNADGDDFNSAGYCANPEQAGTGLVQTSTDVGVWNHLVLVTADLQTQLFLNGELVSTGFVEDVGCTNSNVLHIGHRAGSSGRFFKGKIDDFAIWNRALNDAEVAGLFSLEPPIQGCTDTAACNYNFEAFSDDGSCEYGCLNCGPGTVWNDSVSQCLPSPLICNEGTYWDAATQSCMPLQSCEEDLNSDGIIGIADLLQLLSTFGEYCEETIETSEWTCGDPMNYHDYYYATVQIGDQCWFSENLQSEYYQNGDGLQADLSNLEWTNANFGTQCIYENIDENLGLYGRLYNWHAVNDERGVCPANWHVPSQTEWFALVDYAAPESGLKLKADSLSTPAWNGTDYLGFSATPAGRRDYASGQFLVLNEHAYWWTGTQTSDDRARLMHISSELTVVESLNYFFEHGFSVRCIKDTE